jgi:UDP-galactopyranose mutase
MSDRQQVMYNAFQDEMSKIAVSGKLLLGGGAVLGTAVAAPYAVKRWKAGGKELEESRLSRMRKKLQEEEMKYSKKYQGMM